MKFIIVAPKFLRFITGGFAKAIVLFPFIILSKVADKYDTALIRHEQIHIYQQLELLVIGFYLWYAIEYVVYRLKGYNHLDAYMRLSHEQEARYYECNLEERRKLFGFLRYL